MSRNPVYRYLDLEAGVENDETREEVEDSDEESNFVVADGSADHEKSDRLYHWNELDTWDNYEESPGFLENLAQDIITQHRTGQHSTLSMNQQNQTHATSDHPITQFPQAEDLIYSVKVKVGLERDVVVAIFQKILNSPLVYNVRSVFCRDAIKGTIYIESDSIDAVQNVLNRVSGVARSTGVPHQIRGLYAIHLVDIQDRHLLLDMDTMGATPPIKTNTWVRIKRGRYKGDLGLVKYVERTTLVCDTLIVPRIPMNPINRKRKRGVRIPQLAFDPEAIDEAYGQGSADKRNRVYLFQGERYEDGLLCQEIHMTGLSIEGINATPQELEPFRKSTTWNEAATFISPIRTGDWVQVVSGAFVGMVGEVLEVSDMIVKIVGKRTEGHWENVDNILSDEDKIRPRWGEAQKDTREVLTRDVRKAFEIGDFVQVIHGWDRGLEGFLVGLQANSAIIYVLPPEDDAMHNQGGREFIAKVNDIEWRSNANHVFDVIPPTHEFSRTKFDPKHPEGLPFVPIDPSLKLGKRTVDRYKHMEVQILKGEAKRHFGVIKGTHKSPEGEELFDVQTSTKAVNSVIIFHSQDLQERFTKMPINKACWIPARFRTPQVSEQESEQRPTTPSYLENTSNSIDGGAWDVSSRTPDLIISEPVVSIAGSWLLDSRLLFKKLDVRIQGTTRSHPPWQSGKFEGQLGFVVLTSRVQSVQTSTVVKTGFSENRALLQIQHLVPEQSTEVPTYLTTNVTHTSIFAVPGSRIVIIGPDIEGCTDYVGSYALVVHSTYTLPPGCAPVQIASPGRHWGKFIYLDISSACRSLLVRTPIDWFGIPVH